MSKARGFSDRDRLIALAGIYQAAGCTLSIAHRGLADEVAMAASLYSVFQTDAADVPAVYQGLHRVAPGLRQLVAQIQGREARDMELTRYVISLILLERRLARNPDRLERIAAGIEAARADLAHLSLLHPSILAQLADIYTRTLSSLRPRVMVKGKELYLRHPEQINRVRALLLAGIRAARLWRQVGGTRWQILFGRRALLQGAMALLEEIAKAPESVPPASG